METTTKLVPMPGANAPAPSGQPPENVLLALSQVYALVQNSIQTSTMTQASVGTIMEQAQSDISSIITALVSGASTLMSKIQDDLKAMGPLGYVILALMIVVIIAAVVAAVVATGGAAAFLGAGLAAAIASVATTVGAGAAILAGAVMIAKGILQCIMAGAQDKLAVVNGVISNSNGNQQMWMSDSKHVGGTIDNNGQVESSIESLIHAAIVGAGSASIASSHSIRNSL